MPVLRQLRRLGAPSTHAQLLEGCAQEHRADVVAPTWFLRRFCGNYVGSVFLGAAIKQLGMRGRSWVNFGTVGKASRGQHKKHLKRVARLVAK